MLFPLIIADPKLIPMPETVLLLMVFAVIIGELFVSINIPLAPLLEITFPIKLGELPFM